MRRALPALAVTAVGLTWLLRVQGVIDAGEKSTDLTAGADPAAPSPSAGAAPVEGPSVDTPYGPVQVTAVLRAGHLDDVKTVKVPDVDANSKRLTAEAVPVLRKEALAAQSARIDTVAGATFTSEGYRKSLQGALDAGHFGPAVGVELADGTTTTTLLDPGGETTTTVAPFTWPTGPNGAPLTWPSATVTTARPGAPVTTKPPSGPVTTPPPTGGGKPPVSGTFAGRVVTQQFGGVQATVTFSGGVLAGCKGTGPTDNPTSAGINNNALPKLCSAAVQAKSANIAGVSGATLTSTAFKASLQDALDKAAHA